MHKKKRLFLLAESRSGSNWLTETINSHPEIYLAKEIFQPNERMSFYQNKNYKDLMNVGRDIDYLETFIKESTAKLSGCKILFSQAFRFIDFYNFLHFYKDQYFIVLQRKNIVKAELSGEIARRSKKWHLKNNEHKLTKIKVNIADFCNRLEWRRFRNNFTLNMLTLFGINYYKIDYVALFQSKESMIKKILNFLNVEIDLDSMNFSNEKKMNPFLAEEIIENFTELELFLKGYPEYHKFLNNKNRYS